MKTFSKEKKPLAIRSFLSAFYKKHLRRIPLFSCWLILLYFGFNVLLGVFTHKRFFIENIKVEGLSSTSGHLAEARLSRFIGKNALFIDEKDILASIISISSIKEARVDFNFPNFYTVSVEEWKSRGVIALEHIYHLNQEGRIFRRLKAGESIGEKILFLGFEKKLFENLEGEASKEIKRLIKIADVINEKTGSAIKLVSIESGSTVVLEDEKGLKYRIGRDYSRDYLEQLKNIKEWMVENRVRAEMIDLDSPKPSYFVLINTSVVNANYVEKRTKVLAEETSGSQ